MKIKLLNFEMVLADSNYLSFDVLSLGIITRKLNWYGSLFALDLTQMYGTIQILFVFTFFIYDR